MREKNSGGGDCGCGFAPLMKCVEIVGFAPSGVGVVVKVVGDVRAAVLVVPVAST